MSRRLRMPGKFISCRMKNLRLRTWLPLVPWRLATILTRPLRSTGYSCKKLPAASSRIALKRLWPGFNPRNSIPRRSWESGSAEIRVHRAGAGRRNYSKFNIVPDASRDFAGQPRIINTSLTKDLTKQSVVPLNVSPLWVYATKIDNVGQGKSILLSGGRMRSSQWWIVFVCLFVTLPFASAQKTSGTITGTVVDPSGAVVQGATVALVNSATGATRNTSTNDQGSFTFPELSAGTYKVSVNKTGFKQVTQNNVELHVADVTALNV